MSNFSAFRSLNIVLGSGNTYFQYGNVSLSSKNFVYWNITANRLLHIIY